MNKKVLLTLGTLSTLVPAISAVSCSTTWTRWSADKNAVETKTVFKREYAPHSAWRARQDVEIMKAFDVSTGRLDVNKINNQYELLVLITKLLKLKTGESIDAYWNQYPKMKTFLSNITKVVHVHIGSKKIDWDVTSIITKAIAGIDDYKVGDARKYDVEKNGLDRNGQPKDFQEVALAGQSMTSIPLVASLLRYDSTFALGMSKLVNLPVKTYEAIQEFLMQINSFMDDIWNAIVPEKPKTEQEAINDKTPQEIWNKDHSVIKEWDFTVSATNGKYNAIDVKELNHEKPYTTFLKGNLLIKAFKA